MTSQRPLFWRVFVLPIFGPKVQAEATLLYALKTAKIKLKMTTFMKLLGPCRKGKYFFLQKYLIYLRCRICELEPIFLNNLPQSLQGPSSFIIIVVCSSILAILKASKTVACACTFEPKINRTKARQNNGQHDVISRDFAK